MSLWVFLFVDVREKKRFPFIPIRTNQIKGIDLPGAFPFQPGTAEGAYFQLILAEHTSTQVCAEATHLHACIHGCEAHYFSRITEIHFSRVPP